MANTFKLEIITPEKRFYEGQVEMVIVNTVLGEEGFKYNHSPACMMLDIGEIRIYEEGGKVLHASSTDGFIDIADNLAVIFVDAIEFPEDLDEARLNAKIADLEEKLSHPKDFDGGYVFEFNKSLRKAKLRKKLLAKYGGNSKKH